MDWLLHIAWKRVELTLKLKCSNIEYSNRFLSWFECILLFFYEPMKRGNRFAIIVFCKSVVMRITNRQRNDNEEKIMLRKKKKKKDQYCIQVIIKMNTTQFMYKFTYRLCAMFRSFPILWSIYLSRYDLTKSQSQFDFVCTRCPI